MKKELEKEAKEYSHKTWDMVPTYMDTSSERENSITDFIAGAKSKYVEKQKLEFAIELLNQLEFDPKEDILDFVLHIESKIKELEEKLKQL